MITICAKFNLFPDNTVLGTSFNHSSFTFSGKSLTPIFVNETKSEKGITIQPIGITVEFMLPVDNANFRVGIWDSNPINVIAKDAAGNVVSTKVISGNNQYIDSFIKGNKIKSLDFDTIGKEELLVSICIDIPY